MNQGKRHIRNTVVALLGATVLIAGASRIYASAVDENTPGWLRSLMSLGLEVAAPEAESRVGKPVEVNLGDVREFTQVEVEGPFAVEVIGAMHHRVSVTPAAGSTWNFGAEWAEGGPLRIKGGPEAAGAVLRIEAPTLTSIDVQGVDLLTVRGLASPEVSLRMKDVKAVRIAESKVGTWKMDAATLTQVRLGSDSSAQLMKISGKSTIRYVLKQEAALPP